MVFATIDMVAQVAGRVLENSSHRRVGRQVIEGCRWVQSLASARNCGPPAPGIPWPSVLGSLGFQYRGPGCTGDPGVLTCLHVRVALLGVATLV